MSEKTIKSSRKFNFFDVFLIILILAVLAAVVFLFVLPNMKSTSGIIGSSNSNEVTIEYKLRVGSVSDELKLQIEEGDTVVDSINKGEIGKVVSWEKQKDTYYGADIQNGAFVNEPSMNEYLLFITIRAKATKTEKGYEIEQKDIFSGDNGFTFQTPHYVATGNVLYVKEVEDDVQ